MVFAISHWSTDFYDSAATHNAAAAAALSKFGVFGLLVDAIVCRSDTRRLLVSPKVARAMRWRRSERDRRHFRPTPIFACFGQV